MVWNSSSAGLRNPCSLGVLMAWALAAALALRGAWGPDESELEKTTILPPILRTMPEEKRRAASRQESASLDSLKQVGMRSRTCSKVLRQLARLTSSSSAEVGMNRSVRSDITSICGWERVALMA